MEKKTKGQSQVLQATIKELDFQVQEKEKRTAELLIANKELILQNLEKERNAAKLQKAHKELLFQNAEREKRAAELIIANHELVLLNSEKEKRALELITLNNELTTFTYIASHDLQEPLRKIQTFADRIQTLESSNLTVDGVELLKRMTKSARRMQQLIYDLLIYTRSSSKEDRFKKTNLNNLVEEVLEDLKEIVESKKAVFKIEVLGSFNIHASQIRQVFFNLISNALKFSEPGRVPKIAIGKSIIKGQAVEIANISPEQEYLAIKVEDNGIGFNTEYKDKIFEVFQRLHGNEEYSGTGIGLAIVKKIINNHRGFITVDSDLGLGSRFYIYIPSNLGITVLDDTIVS